MGRKKKKLDKLTKAKLDYKRSREIDGKAHDALRDRVIALEKKTISRKNFRRMEAEARNALLANAHKLGVHESGI